jgi:CDGSH-type Zn-finger protein
MMKAFVTSPARAMNSVLSRPRAICSGTVTRPASMTLEPLNADNAFAMKASYDITTGKKAAVCRCWKSKKHPLCDGSHNAFNKETGSNIGPLVVSAVPAEE